MCCGSRTGTSNFPTNFRYIVGTVPGKETVYEICPSAIDAHVNDRLRDAADHVLADTRPTRNCCLRPGDVGAITWETNDAVLTMYPTFRFQTPSDIPTFTLMVQNKTNHDIDFQPESIHAYFDERECHVYTLEERVGEIRSSAKRKQIALAVLGGIAAAGAGYAASHQTATVTSYGSIGRRQYFNTSTIRVLRSGLRDSGGSGGGRCDRSRHSPDRPVRGLRGTSGTGASFSTAPFHPGTTMVGQVMLKKGAGEAGALRLDVPVAAARTTFNFAKKTHQRLIPRSSITSRRPREFRGGCALARIGIDQILVSSCRCLCGEQVLTRDERRGQILIDWDIYAPLPRIFELDAANPRHGIYHYRWSIHAKQAIRVREILHGTLTTFAGGGLTRWYPQLREGMPTSDH